VNLLDKQRGRRPHRIAGEGVVGFQVAGERVVVNEMHRRLRAHPARGGEALRVHDGDALDRRAAPQVAPPDEGQLRAVEVKELLDIAVDARGQHGQRRGVQQVRSQQRRHSVEVGVIVRQDQLHRLHLGWLRVMSQES